MRPQRDIVVMGASAGGVEALTSIASALPRDLVAAIFVILHLPEAGPSVLADILDGAGPLPARRAQDDRPIEPGVITVCPPGRHLLVEPGRMRLVRGPKINGYRPSVDALFHSAARSYGGRVVGVVLTGTLSDGTLGLRAIKRRNGMAIVQADAIHQGMPTSAIANVDVDVVVPVDEIARELTMMVQAGKEGAMAKESTDSELEAGFDLGQLEEAPGDPTVFRCPECGGALWEIEDDGLRGFVCHVGHSFSSDSMLSQQDDQVERALWSALRLLEEAAALNRRLAERLEDGSSKSKARFEAKAHAALADAEVLRDILQKPGEDDEAEAAA